jgi:hypothetical protein
MTTPDELKHSLLETSRLRTALLGIKRELGLRRSPPPTVKAGFNEEEPRDWRGRWTLGGGGINDSRVLSDAMPDPIVPWADYAADGHHYVSRSVFGNPKYSLSPEALAVFETEKTGSLNVPESNRYDQMHRDYNRAVEESLDRFLKTNNIDPKQMTTEQAKAFAGQVKGSDDPRIRRFNMRIWMRESMYWLRRGVRGRE